MIPSIHVYMHNMNPICQELFELSRHIKRVDRRTDRRTDGQTDRWTDKAITVLSMQGANNHDRFVTSRRKKSYY